MSTTTTTKIATSKISTSSSKRGKDNLIYTEVDMRKMRDEMAKKEEEHLLKVKELKETILKMKVDAAGEMNRNLGVLFMGKMREEINKASDFLKIMMMDGIMNYEIARDLALENVKVPKEDIMKKKISEKRFMNNSEDLLLTSNCGCSTCMMNKMSIFGKTKKANHKTEVGFNLSGKIAMGLHFDNKILSFQNINTSGRTKELVFHDIRNSVRKEVLRIRFIFKKREIPNDYIINFNQHPELNFKGENTEMSMSSMIISKTLRMDHQSSYIDTKRVLLSQDKKENKCFINWFCETTGKMPYDEMAKSISDLTMEEEANLLTFWGEKEVYIHIDDSKEELNHISSTPFQNCTKIRVMFLSAPLLRFTSFFSDTWEEVKADYESIQDLETEVENTMLEMSSRLNSPNMYKYIAMKQGILCSDFHKNCFHNKHYYEYGLLKGLDIRRLTLSEMATLTLNSTDPGTYPLYILNMDKDWFRGVCYFLGNNHRVPQYCLEWGIMSMVDYSEDIPMRIFNNWAPAMEGLMEGKNASHMIKEFLSDLKEANMVDEDFLERMHIEMTKRAYLLFLMSSAANECNSKKNEEYHRTKDSISRKRLEFFNLGIKISNGDINSRDSLPDSIQNLDDRVRAEMDNNLTATNVVFGNKRARTFKMKEASGTL